MGLVRDYTPQDMLNNIILHASLGKTYGLPVVITTSADTGNFLLVIPLAKRHSNHSFYCAVKALTAPSSLRSPKCTQTSP